MAGRDLLQSNKELQEFLCKISEAATSLIGFVSIAPMFCALASRL